MKKDDKFVPENWRTLAVLPFTGNEAFNRTAAEFFAFQLDKQKHFQIIAPGKIEIMLKRNGTALASGGLTVENGQNVARVIGADAVFIGKITIPVRGYTLVASVEVSLIDVPTGQAIASVVQSNLGHPTFRMDALESVANATERAAADMLAVLEELSIRRRSVKGD